MPLKNDRTLLMNRTKEKCLEKPLTCDHPPLPRDMPMNSFSKQSSFRIDVTADKGKNRWHVTTHHYHCCNLSGGVALIVWFTTNGMCVKNITIIYVTRASNSKRDCEHHLYCCLLPRCEALRTCRSGFPIATPRDMPMYSFSKQSSFRIDYDFLLLISGWPNMRIAACGWSSNSCMTFWKYWWQIFPQKIKRWQRNFTLKKSGALK